MTYARFDDRFHHHPKVWKVGPAAAWMWAASIGHCNEHLTDGFVDSGSLPQLSMVSMAASLKLAEKLVAARLWDVEPGGYRVHDFLDWNESAATVKARREATANRVKKHYDKHRTDGASNDAANPKPNALGNGLLHHPRGRASESESESESEETRVAAVAATLPGLDPAKPITKARKARSPRPPPEPMPWTLPRMLDELAESSNGRVIIAPFVTALATPLTAVIRELAAGGAEWPDIPLVGEWIAAGGCGFMKEGIDLAWLAKAGNLAGLIGKARRWDDDGRPPISESQARQSAAPDNRNRPDRQVLNGAAR